MITLEIAGGIVSKTATLEAFLKSLAAKFGETAQPEVVRRA